MSKIVGEVRGRLKDAIARTGLHGSIGSTESVERIIAPNGGTQTWMIDLRSVFLNKDALEDVAEIFWEIFGDRPPFQVGTVEVAGIPLLTAIILSAPSNHSEISGFILRKERKKTGLGNIIEGSLNDNPIVFIDDILNSGSSIEKSSIVLDELGRNISELFVVIDYRSRAGEEWRRNRKVEVVSAFVLEEFGISLTVSERRTENRYFKQWRTCVEGGFPFHVVPKSEAILVGDRLYRGCDSGRMHAFSANSGEVVWEFSVGAAHGNKGIWSSPAYHEGRIYFGAYDGSIYCLDAIDGREIWKVSCCDWIGSSPLIVARHGLLYIGLEYEQRSMQGSLSAFDLATGNAVWHHPVLAFQHGSAAYWEGGDKIIWGAADHEMLSMDAATGDVAWSFKTRRSVKCRPAIDEKRKIAAFASFDKSIYVLDLESGQKLAEWETGDICYTTPLIHNGKLYCGSADKKLYIADLNDMSLAAVLPMDSRIFSNVRAVGPNVIFGTTGGRVIEINTDTFDVVGMVQLPDAITNAVTVDIERGRLFVSTYMNYLYSFARVTRVESRLNG